ncbi:uncharacterized protein K02A2.6-like, partial [Anneissia japonica]|uniref:uncharacterized protein K02A2.6-like n=1 Tax=Anneissia japonica TaxID=1529436 RepID=UPI0014259115
MRVTARVVKACSRRSLKALVEDLSVEDLKKAECLWVKELQKPMLTLLRENKSEFDKKYATLGPRLREDEVIVVGDRIKNHVHFSYNHETVQLLPCDHPVTRLIVENVHAKGHTGISATVAKVRSHYWVIRLRQLVKRVKHDCIPCRRFEKEAAGQQMATVPIHRLKPSPPWAYIGIDLFGPFVVRGEVQKRTRGKAYGVIINCLVTRAIHLDIASDYSTEAFLQVFRRFVSVRGYPKKVYTDCGTQLSAADKALKGFRGEQGVKWKFTTPNAPWQNGVTENLLRG